MTKTIRIGTRGSALALAQANMTAAAITAAHPDTLCEIVTIVTSGDLTQAGNRPLSESGNKGLFTKEIEEALLKGEIDCAVHSMKDMPTKLPDGLIIPCLLPREDARDAFFSQTAKSIEDLPKGATVGSSSIRRQAILRHLRPDLNIVTFRGNVDTRLKKLYAGEVDATLLAAAGVNRLGRAADITSLIDTAVMLPAPAQGAVGIEVREDDARLQKTLSAIHCAVTDMRVAAERAFLAVMDGSCQTPLAALMSVPDNQGRARFDALKISPDGRDIEKTGADVTIKSRDEAVLVGIMAGETLLARAK